MKIFDPYISLIGRIMLALIFVLSGVSKIGAFEATQGYMEAMGLPGIFLIPTIAFEIGAGLAIAMGFMTRLAAFSLVCYSLITAVIFHSNFADPIQTIMFLKNVSMAGGLLLLVRYGASTSSIDNRFFSKFKEA